MKRLITFMLLFSLLLSGCSSSGEWIKEPVTFYYVQCDYQKDMEQVIVSEVREASGHRNDLPYLLALYSMGPSSEDLESPFPKNTTILPTARTPYSIELTLSENAAAMTDSNLTLASACIALTCMELTDVQQVSVICGDWNITIREDNLVLYMTNTPDVQEETK